MTITFPVEGEERTEKVCDECQKAQAVYQDGCVDYCEACYEDFLERRKEDESEEAYND